MKMLTSILLTCLTSGGAAIAAAPTTPEAWAGILARAPAPATHRMAPPRWPEPVATFFVAPDGSDANPGTRERPLGSLPGARSAIRALKARSGLPGGGVTVWVRGGHYPVRQTFALSSGDSGTSTSPVLYRAAVGEQPVFTGGIRLRQFETIGDPRVRARLPELARDRVVKVDLTRHGVTNLLPVRLGGFGSGLGFRTHPLMELYVDGEPLTLARGPDEGFLQIAAVSTQEVTQVHGVTGSKAGRFTYTGDRPARWKDEPELLLYGYWFWDWADSYERVVSIDPERREIELAPPFHTYGFRPGQRFYAVHALAELDRPGEWYLDRARGALYFWPPRELVGARVELATADCAFVELNDVSHVVFEGLTWELGCRDGMMIQGGTGVLLAGCTLRQFAGNGVEVRGGTGHGLLSCDLHTLGRGGTILEGGDRRTLQPGGHFVENCHVHHLSRIDHTYTPAVLCGGVGQRLSRNWFHDVGSSAIRLGGNDHRVELNEISRVVLESDDQGAVDMWGDATYRGNVYRHNFFHHIGSQWATGQEPRLGQAGIRLDDAISGTLIQGNVFFRVGGGGHGFGGVQIHGGKDNLVDQNLFIDCAAAVSFSPWGDRRWREFVAAALDAPAIDRALYLARYPELQRLAEAHDVNWIRRNLALNCVSLLHRDSGRAQNLENRALDGHPAFPVTPAGGLTLPTSATAWTEAGLNPIPAGEIGLYEDGYRRTLPARAQPDRRGPGRAKAP